MAKTVVEDLRETLPEAKQALLGDATIEAQLFVPAVPYPQWDYNWDHRDFDSHGKRPVQVVAAYRTQQGNQRWPTQPVTRSLSHQAGEW
mgnify:CR=1 FL=1